MSTEVLSHKPVVESEGIHHDSEEYESAEEVDEVGEEGEVYEDEEVEEVEIEVEEEEEEEDQVESVKEKVLDGDEDRKNPQFIPKKGYFYEHDDRRGAEEEEEDPEVEEEQKKEEVKPKKVVVKDVSDRWSHDMYDEEDQAPKTEEELSTRYGYDIRSDDQAPRARRRRRYGRGPNKYTPNWEEEESHQRGRGGYRGRNNSRGGGGGGSDYRNNYRQGPRGGGGGSGGFDEEFPELPSGKSKTTEQTKKEPEEWPSDQRRNRDRNNTGDRDRGYGNQNQNRESDYADRDNRGGGGSRGAWRGQGWRGQGQGQGGGRGRGGRVRRNEFTNRNRYPDRRSSVEDGGSSGGSQNLNPEPRTPRTQPQHNGSERSPRTVDNKTETISPKAQTTPLSVQGLGLTAKPPQHQPQPQMSRKPTLPFTNTEYTGSASLTAGRGQGHGMGRDDEGRSPRQEPRPAPKRFEAEHDDRNNKPRYNEHDDRNNKPRYNEHDDRGRGQGQSESHDLVFNQNRERERDNEEHHQDVRLDRQNNREPNRYNNKGGYQNERRSQMPPRLQQQQQQQLNAENNAIKTSKRFSAQRQRQPLEQNMANLSVSSGPPLLNQQIGPQGVPATSGVGPQQQLGTSPVPVPATVMAAYANHPPPQAYYEPVPTSYDTQMYEGTGNPVTVSGSTHTHGHGPTVSPALWGPHSSTYVTAPYASPTAGQGVPQPPMEYGNPSTAAFIAAAQGGGQTIYAPPHAHPQFIQDPTLINYPPPGPPPTFAPPPFHPAGYQGFSQVAPAPPELYHGGVTYYSTQNQIPRPHIPAVSKRPKSMLQLVEPPEKKDVGRNRSPRNPVHSEDHYQYEDQGHQSAHSSEPTSYEHEAEHSSEPEISSHHTTKDSVSPQPNEKDLKREASPTPVLSEQAPAMETSVERAVEEKLQAPLAASEELEPEQSRSVENSLQPADTGRVRKSPSPAPFELPDEKSWSEQMSDVTPISSPVDKHPEENKTKTPAPSDKPELTSETNTNKSDNSSKVESLDTTPTPSEGKNE